MFEIPRFQAKEMWKNFSLFGRHLAIKGNFSIQKKRGPKPKTFKNHLKTVG